MTYLLSALRLQNYLRVYITEAAGNAKSSIYAAL